MIAYYSVTNILGILILDIKYGIDDTIIWRYSNESKIRKSKLKETKEGIKFRVGRQWFYLSEFTKVL